jgi:peptidoglycan hydrolase-like protein with peptidoglycan-binding domain
LHFELSPEMANNPAKFQAAWDALPAPGSVATAGRQIIKPNPAKVVNDGGRPAPAPTPAGPAFPGALDVGSKGESVKLVQAKVGAKTDGDFGPATGRSVSAWREANGFSKGTKVGPKVWKAMFG